ncbi:zinc finger BED domain-containing protein RICESLEEPER 2-like [Hordeum vulgare subsp. vulgare]|uniref:zinc finger BED domain-containing protein RICESLEEPER 2-like n=1 Tax=Hordeum vulgare subsp. vulgare TaxID=112509 RepID=UPI001D1A538F|nr:zinc finger BED domain-containing protein RICESLEEPER 2-like [Hordeum vulgare subsp. vulgare]
MIVLHEYPLCIVDLTGFRRFVSALQPLFKMVTRNTIRNDIEAHYEEERKRAIEYMATTKSRVAITTDMWTSDHQKKGYMAITTHFIDDNWNLRSVIMRFIYVPAPHTTEAIANELYESLVTWNLDEKLSAVTVDNCTSNDKAVDHLLNKIGKEKLMLKGMMLHMRCRAHILNLIVKDGLDVLKAVIEKISESVVFWTSTPKRVEKFEEIAKFQKVKMGKKLALDCKTRWNSTFTMLHTALPYKAVFERAKKVEKLYDCYPSDYE